MRTCQFQGNVAYKFFVRDTQSECSFLDIVNMASKRKQTTQPTSVNRECMLEQLLWLSCPI